MCATIGVEMFTVIGILHYMRLNALQKMEDVAMKHLWLAWIAEMPGLLFLLNEKKGRIEIDE